MHRASGTGRIGMVAAVAMLVLAAPTMAQWQIQPITAVPVGASSGTFGAPPAMTFDSQNRPHVAYLLASDGNVVHTYGSAGGAAGAWIKPNTSVSIGDLGISAVVHLAAAGGSVYLSSSGDYSMNPMVSAVFDGTSWQRYAPTGFPTAAVVAGMATNNSGQVNWIIWNKTSALYPSVDATSPSGTTVIWATPSQLDTGGKMSMAPTDTATPYSGYYLVRPAAPTTVEATPVTYGPVAGTAVPEGRPDDILRLDGDMTFDSTGNLHMIQYYDFGNNGQLVYATGPVGGPYTVDSSINRGWWAITGRPGLAVDASNRPHIVYTSLWPYYRLNYVTRDGTGWKRQTIEAGGKRNGFVGTFPKALVDLSGTLHVIYADGLHGVVKHAKLVNSQWQIETIDTVGTQASYTAQTGALAAAMDSAGGIGVTYWDAADAMLKYAYLAPGATAAPAMAKADSGK